MANFIEVLYILIFYLLEWVGYVDALFLEINLYSCVRFILFVRILTLRLEVTHGKIEDG